LVQNKKGQARCPSFLFKQIRLLSYEVVDDVELLAAGGTHGVVEEAAGELILHKVGFVVFLKQKSS